MKHSKLIHLLAIPAVLALALFAAAACGDDDQADTGNGTPTPEAAGIDIMDPFGRATLDRASAYFTIVNNGSEDDALVSVATSVAGKAELHETVTSGAETKMQPVDQIDVPAGGKAELKPGGYHVMLTELTQDLKEGDQYTLTLEFEKAGKMDVPITVKSYTEDSGSGMGGMASPTGGMAGATSPAGGQPMQ